MNTIYSLKSIECRRGALNKLNPHVSVVWPLLGFAWEWIDHTYMGFKYIHSQSLYNEAFLLTK